MVVAFQGELGAYSEAAAQRFAPDASLLPCPSFEDVFRAVEAGTATFGVLPIENSIGGTIHRNYDLLLEHALQIVGDLELRVVHSLIALPGTAIDQIKTIYSHPQALAQCDRYLRSLPGVEVVATYDTAGSAKLIKDRQLAGAAAIASERAAAVFELKVLESGIQDFADNITRFLVVAPAASGPRTTPTNKTTVVFTLANEAGALFRALSVFALRGIDLTKLESRPIPGRPWEYLFYVDLAVGAEDARCDRALAHLAEFAPVLRNLGSYASTLLPRSTAATTTVAAGDLA
ncbi:P-protein [Luteitalea pratensis]|uniref:Prephenate dehydratase n=1 Tax=Luteitalea pratensis TaxID=1855912 RepID=A0A143PMV7_LUTPR|nr:prephenate dehydratase [Luteitalea pratensis]AMY09957.1 P-protein [Luteitalea pratensis]